MTRASGKRLTYLRLVRSSDQSAPPVLVSSTARKEFEHLTQRLVDLLIEMLDVADGDPDLEPNGDELDVNGDELEPNGDEFEPGNEFELTRQEMEQHRNEFEGTTFSGNPLQNRPNIKKPLFALSESELLEHHEE